jgi:Ankyrin repeats (3 copies)
MASGRLCVGFSSACKQAREGGGLPATPERPLFLTSDGLWARSAALPYLPPDLVHLIDSLVRRLEHEDVLLRMNGGVLGHTLCLASAAGGLLDVRFLLARGANTEFLMTGPNGLQWSPLEWAARRGQCAAAELLLDSGARRLSDALTDAAVEGHADMIALLLDRGADVHYWEDTAVGLAAEHGHLDSVRLLLDRGADVHADNEYAVTMARRNAHAAVVALLLERGAVELEDA